MARLSAVIEDLLGVRQHAREGVEAADRALSLLVELLAACEALELAGHAGRARSVHAQVTTWRRELDRLIGRAGALIEYGQSIASTTASSDASASATQPSGGAPQDMPRSSGPDRAGIPAGVPEWTRRAGRGLPIRGRASPTQGQVFDSAGRALSRLIGSSTDRTLIADLTLSVRERHSMSLLSHVEAKVAALIRNGALPVESVLVINNEVCKGELGCDVFLPSILPRGARLRVYVADESGIQLYRVYEGTGSRIKS